MIGCFSRLESILEFVLVAYALFFCMYLFDLFRVFFETTKTLIDLRLFLSHRPVSIVRALWKKKMSTENTQRDWLYENSYLPSLKFATAYNKIFPPSDPKEPYQINDHRPFWTYRPDPSVGAGVTVVPADLCLQTLSELLDSSGPIRGHGNPFPHTYILQ